MSFFKRRKEASVKGKLKVKVRSEAVYLFVSLSIALYLVGMSNESDSAYFISRVLLLVPAVSFVFGLMNISGVVCQARFVRNRIHEGDETHICTEVTNYGSLSKTNLLLCVGITNKTLGSEHLAQWLLPTVGGEQAIHLNPLTAGKLKRGENLIEFVEVGCQSPLGAFWLVRQHTCSDVCIVYPKLLCDSRSLSFHKWMSSGSFMFQDRLDYRGVREYEPSDDVRLIHWMSSAKRGELVVKLPEYHQSLPCTIALYAPDEVDKADKTNKTVTAQDYDLLLEIIPKPILRFLGLDEDEEAKEAVKAETMWNDEPILEHMIRFAATLAVMLHDMKWEVTVLAGQRKVTMRARERRNDVPVLFESLATLKQSDAQRRFPMNSIVNDQGVFVLLTTCSGVKEFDFTAMPRRKRYAGKLRYVVVHFCVRGVDCQAGEVKVDGVSHIAIKGVSGLLPALQECVKLLLQDRAVMSHV